MKNISLILIAVIIFGGLTSSVLYHTGSPGHKTGSPGDGNNCTQCHSGSPIQTSGWIESNIPLEGYIPGAVYQLVVHGSHPGAQRYGFEMTSEATGNAKKGVFEVTDAVRNQLIDAQGTAITHTDGGISPQNDSASWTFNWIAPVTGTGDVTFYLAVNAANGNSNPSGDVIYLSNQLVSEAIVESISDLSSAEFSVYPNPASDRFSVTSEYPISGIILSNSSGSMVKKLEFNAETNPVVEISDLAKGVYYIQLISQKQIPAKRMLIL